MNRFMRKLLCVAALLSSTLIVSAQWKPASTPIISPWGEQVNPQNVLPEYPRPVMERGEWQNLNGLWDYAILPTGGNSAPESYDGKILVPFPVESGLSGVGKELNQNQELWYHRTFSIPSKWKDKKIMLNFGAVDWKADVYINDVKVGTHTGGYAPFSFDITPFLKKSREQKLVVRVWDPTSFAIIPKGKQRNDGMMEMGLWWYPAVSGIWQTVWMEPVSEQHIANLKMVPDIDTNLLHVDIESKNTNVADRIEFNVFNKGKLIASQSMATGEMRYESVTLPFNSSNIVSARAVCRQSLDISIPSPELWSPDSPFLYDVEVNLYHKNKKVDQLKSYFGMRKIAVARDAQGFLRLQLNNKFLFQHGPLDQGWWPDGLYTAPSDEALAYDIQKTKEMGYNMIRKHGKIEPARWYTHCDRIGILVWQDMPNCGYDRMVQSPECQALNYFNGKEILHSPAEMENFCKEWKEIIDCLYSYPSIVTWIPFNEGWGQFGTKEIADWTKRYDPSRMVDAASGGNHYLNVGDMLDTHFYPGPEMKMFNPDRVNVIGEFGPCGLQIKGHSWFDSVGTHDPVKLEQEYKKQTDIYVEAMDKLKGEIDKGCSAAVYCEAVDTYVECNGFISFDRKKRKFNEPEFVKANKEISSSLDKLNHK